MLTFSIHVMIEMMKRRQGQWKSTKALSCICCHRLDLDLTKVVLPTFILEKRSLLETYAECFTHPDLFVSISDQKDARDRMVQVVKWYLSAFHAGRKGSVAKKPYNPILGEIFQCHWTLPNDTEENAVSSPLMFLIILVLSS